jgi:Peptidase family C25/CARDB
MFSKFSLSLIALCFLSVTLQSQPLNNEWINYNATYYKFSVGSSGVYQIPFSTLQLAGLQNTNAQDFKLMRNGTEVALLISKPLGPLQSNDFIEFIGVANDGSFDKALYKNPSYQLNNKLSLFSDTATYFLTVNTASTNLRYTNIGNNVAANILPPQQFLEHSVRINFKDKINRGYAVNVGEDVYASWFDLGEGFSTRDIDSANPYLITLPKLNLYSATDSCKLLVAMGGNSYRNRIINVGINATNILSKQANGYTDDIFIDSSVKNNIFLVNNTLKISINNSGPFDRVVANFAELQYNRNFDCNAQSTFSFTMPSSNNSKFIQFSNFNRPAGSTVYLYNTTNNSYQIADTNSAGLLSFVVTNLPQQSSFILMSNINSNKAIVSNISKKIFVDYSVKQGNFLIISNKQLMQGSNHAVEQYKQYRNSVAGGNFAAQIYDIDEITDQFAFGIKRHPLAIRNFLLYTESTFSSKPSNVLLIGKGVVYDQYRFNEGLPFMETQHLVPTFGWPASDIMLVSRNSLDPSPIYASGRISAVSQQEVLDYLQKVKDYDAENNNIQQTLASKLWRKNLIHVVGANDVGLDNLLTSYLNGYEAIIRDTLFGGNVTSFNKKSGTAQTPVTQADLAKLINNGLSMITYFGHSAASGLAYNLNDPSQYSNTNKYPVFLVNGCTAGNFFDYDNTRLTNKQSISEKWVLAPNKGSIAFIASTHFGLTDYLNVFSKGFYKSLAATTGYGNTIGINCLAGINTIKSTWNINSDFFAATHAQQFNLHGDPAIKVYNETKPDYVLEENMVTIAPNFISITDSSYFLDAKIFNIGKATNDSIKVLVKITYPNGTKVDVYNNKIAGIKYQDSVSLKLTINPLIDKGSHSLTIVVDSDNEVAELSENNNSVTKNFIIYEDDITPVFPYNFGIVNTSNFKFSASSTNPFSALKSYLFELDTTPLYNSPQKITKTISSVGGLQEFDAATNFLDSVVYYWRVGALAGTSGIEKWNESSFIFLKNSTSAGGYNQSHFYQSSYSSTQNITKDTANKTFDFSNGYQTLTIKNAVYPNGSSVEDSYSVSINNALNSDIRGICFRQSNLTFNVFNPSTLVAKYNTNTGMPGQFGSLNIPGGCIYGRQWDFAFTTDNDVSRKAAADFMDNQIPNNAYVVVRSISMNTAPFTVKYANDWKQDIATYGAGNNLYDKLKAAGFNEIDSFNRLRSFVYVYQKNNNQFIPITRFSNNETDPINVTVKVVTKPNSGFIVSPKFGRVANWKKLIWDGARTDAYDEVSLKLIGYNSNGSIDTIATYSELQTNNDISFVNAQKYPYLQLMMQVKDTVNISAFKFNKWRLLADPITEGAFAPNIATTFKDTLEVGDNLQMKFAFKNISNINFSDSMHVNLFVTDNANNITQIAVGKTPKLKSGDTTLISANISTQNFSGNNLVFLQVNKDSLPAEQFYFNNIIYKSFYVKKDNLNPLVDVLFDGQHILNGDIVSATPHILISLKDESKYLLLDDTSLITVKVQFPNGTIKQYAYNTDTLRFIAATNNGKNVAKVELNPSLFVDGTYELIVVAKDKSNNLAASKTYNIQFVVNNKPTISNMFNYPNPFTSSTAFVFTLTGLVVPQNLKIQILTVTGKVVKEITKQELGNIHIGRNITDYKWDGTDNFGQALGNGVYLYRIVTSLNGNQLDKFTGNGNQYSTGDNYSTDTDKYFNEGYGKMYLMR